jgi:polar amino acid transport system substrate-binding protein
MVSGLNEPRILRIQAVGVSNLVLSGIFVLILCWLGMGNIANAAQLPEIQQRGYLNIAVKDNLRPLGFRDANGNLQGLGKAIGSRFAF